MRKLLTIHHQSIVFCGFLCLTTLFTYPGIMQLNTHIIGDGGDTLEYFSYLSIIRDNLEHGRAPLAYTMAYRYPIGLDPSLSDVRLFTIVGGLLSTILNDITVYNVLLLMVLTLNPFSMYVLLYSLTKHPGVSVVGGIVFGYSYWVLIAANGSLSKVLLFGFPLLGLTLFRCFSQRKATWSVYAVAFALYIIVLSSVTFVQQVLVVGFFTTVALGIVFPRIATAAMVRVWEYRKEVVIATLLLISFTYLSYRSHVRRLFSPELESSNQLFSVTPLPNLLRYIYPNERHLAPFIASPLLQRFTIQEGWQWNDSLHYIGIPTLILLFPVIFIAVRSKRMLLVWWTLCVVTLFMCSSFVSLEYDAGSLPLFIRYPIQYLLQHTDYFMISFWFFSSVAISLALRVVRVSNTGIAIIIFILCMERVSLRYPTYPVSYLRANKYLSIVRELGGSAVLDVPTNVTTKYNLLPFEYNKPIIGGMLHWFGDTKQSRYILEQDELSRFACETKRWDDITPKIIKQNDGEQILALNHKLADRLYGLGIRSMVIHVDMLQEDECVNVREQLQTFLNPVQKVREQTQDPVERLPSDNSTHSFTRKVHDDGNTVILLVAKQTPE